MTAADMELRKSEVKRKMREGGNMMNEGIYEEERQTQRLTMYCESISGSVFSKMGELSALLMGRL